MVTIAGNDMGTVRSASLSSSHAGFTAIELMVTLAIAAILMAIAMPSFSGIIKNQKIQTTVSDFFAAVNLTRSEAIRRGTRVDLIPAEGGADWGKGWVIFVDRNGNRQPDNDEEIIFTHGPAPKDLLIESAMTDSSTQYLAYNGQGRTRTNDSGQQPQSGSVTFTLDEQVRKIKVNFLGRARICNPAQEPSTC